MHHIYTFPLFLVSFSPWIKLFFHLISYKTCPPPNIFQMLCRHLCFVAINPIYLQRFSHQNGECPFNILLISYAFWFHATEAGEAFCSYRGWKHFFRERRKFPFAIYILAIQEPNLISYKSDIPSDFPCTANSLQLV